MPKQKDTIKIEDLIDNNTKFIYIDENLTSKNFLDIPGYTEKISNAIKETGRTSAVMTGLGKIGGITCAICKLNYNFIAGTIGVAEGKKISNLIIVAGEYKYPLVFICQSGGIRLQESTLALMQMGHIAATFSYWKSCIPVSISLLLSPCMGGTSASIGMMSDIILSVPNAKVGFTGSAVLKDTSINKEDLNRCQTSENQLKAGFIDGIVSIDNVKSTLTSIIKLSLPAKNHQLETQAFSNCLPSTLSIPQKIKLVRSPSRSDNKDYISKLFQNFIELHGDHISGDDPSIFGGLALFNNIPVTVISTTRGHTSEDIIKNNFGMTSPSGYRKVIRLMKLSPKRPIIIFINTTGASPTTEAESAGQSNAIASCITEMASIDAPILTIITGEANSGGAIALSISNSIYMLENSVYSAISPEGFTSLILKDKCKVEDVADLLKISAKDMLDGKIIDGIISEHNNDEEATISDMSAVINNFIKNNYNKYPDDIKYERLQKFSKF